MSALLVLVTVTLIMLVFLRLRAENLKARKLVDLVKEKR